jgi:cysteine synthase A
VPNTYNRAVVKDENVRLVFDDEAWRTKLRLARHEGLLTGVSAGANILIALQVAKELGPGKNVVTVLCDTGERYFSLRGEFPGVTA